ncbi:MAG TPA: NAD-dependent epimerase/dehydratase family protein, partial [Desulfuromonadaceae bacterium]
MKMKTFVTGATGFIGASIVRELLKDGREVRALVRPGSDTANLAGLDVEVWRGDLRDRSSLVQGLQGCDVLYHAAADYRLWTRTPEEMYRINVEGTAAI